jgi:hypothetical protein
MGVKTRNRNVSMPMTGLGAAPHVNKREQIGSERIGPLPSHRDPSDGSVREKPETGIPASKIPTSTISTSPVLDTSTSGLPMTKAKAAYLERLEESHCQAHSAA